MTRNGLKTGQTKADYRQVHRLARRHEIESRRDKIRKLWQTQKSIFASADEIDPAAIKPRLQLIPKDNDNLNNIFWLARMYWSLPYSQGYGRRLRFLIWDEHHRKLMGIVGLQSPPLDFAVRDRSFAYPEGQKTAYVNQMMDAYTVGAVPPYGALLGGKLAALALGANQVRDAYKRRYAGVTTIMDERELPARLIAVTTTSAFGKSSIYDRLRGPDGKIMLRPLGLLESTYGSYHFNGVYKMIKYRLSKDSNRKLHGYGVGPRIRWQVLREGLRDVGLSPELLQHNVPREVFMVSNLRNLEKYVAGQHERPLWEDRPFGTLTEHWREKWLLPRWERLQTERGLKKTYNAYRTWNRKRLILSILNA